MRKKYFLGILLVTIGQALVVLNRAMNVGFISAFVFPYFHILTLLFSAIIGYVVQIVGFGVLCNYNKYYLYCLVALLFAAGLTIADFVFDQNGYEFIEGYAPTIVSVLELMSIYSCIYGIRDRFYRIGENRKGNLGQSFFYIVAIFVAVGAILGILARANFAVESPTLLSVLRTLAYVVILGYETTYFVYLVMASREEAII